MLKNYKLLLLAVCLLVLGGRACQGTSNPYPVIDANFSKVQTHQYGQKYQYYNSQLAQNYYIVRVWGYSYQAGLAYGSLLKNQIKSLIDDIWSYYFEMAQQEFKFIAKLPKPLQGVARTLGIKLLKNVLAANYYITKPYTPRRYEEEYAGIRDGSGIPVKALIQLNMLPQFTRAGCSILGAFGKATRDGSLYHLRALDWDVNNPINKYPVLAFYNLKEKGSHPFVNLGWAGFIGSLTGFGEFTGVGEKVRKQKPVKQNETRIGKPWTYALRDVIQFSSTIDQAVSSLNNTRRTCSIHVGISSIKNNTFRLVEYSHKQFTVYSDHNYPFNKLHEQYEGIVYVSIHEDSDSCFNELIKSNYQQIDGLWITNVLAAQHKTGDTQLATFNFHTKELYFQVSNSTKSAFQRPTLRIQLAEYFKFD